MARVLIVDDEKSILGILQTVLHEEGHSVAVAQDAAVARGILCPGAFDVVVSDIVLPGMTGVELLRLIRVVDPLVQVILMTGAPTLATATDAIRAGAFDYLCKPFAMDAMARSVARAAKMKALDDERRRVQDELERLRQAETETERVQQAQLRMRDEFLSHVSHELRTPLTAVHQFIALMLDGLAGDLNNEQCEYLEIALKNVKQLESLIGDLLDVTRAQAGKLVVTPCAMDLAQTISLAMHTVRHAAVTKNLALSTHVAESLPAVFADPERVQQIVGNLVNNAIKFTPRGGTIRVSAKLERAVSQAAETICISVADSGCGIKPEDQERIFEQLYQVNKTIDQTRTGLGLGLFICRDLVTRQNGSIWVRSRVGEGSTFYFTLPACRTDPKPAPDSPQRV